MEQCLRKKGGEFNFEMHGVAKVSAYPGKAMAHGNSQALPNIDMR
jgi:hypothetical protein